ncbi:hypothetical protein NBRC10512_002907 [Rhodotorula toruloides]|uniref:RHTO0S10e06458g1_1 n=1 Tax=Rhodotorula toruloides TaxID=5286 RepID=A0A061BBD4_RHOTO|nr:RHTO0S10e06458g1_1 [Rhodotorula toruloides]
MASLNDNPDPARPFLCVECGSRYTRQEHLDRHVTAKHRVAKDFVCPTCGKGFARKDILKRHEQGHAKQQAAAAEAAAKGDYYDKGYDSPASNAAKGKKKRVSSIGDAGADDGSGPVKIARVGRACCRCSKSKLRCDGQHPCERCRKAGVDCSFERPPKSGSRSGSVSMQIDDGFGLTPSMESDGDTTSPENAFGLALPTPPPPETWSRQAGSAASALSGMSPYHMPLRGPPQHPALPPTSFSFGPPPVNYYSGRPPDAFNYRPAPYHNAAAFPSLQLPHHGPSPLNPFASTTLPPPPAPASASSQWDNSAYGRQIGDVGSSGAGQLDFLDLISAGAGDQEIDWSILNTGFASQDPVINANSGPVPTGFTPRDGMSPGTGDMEIGSLLPPSLGGNASQPMSDLRNGGIPEEPSPASAAALVLAAAANGDDRSMNIKSEKDTSPERPVYGFRNNSLVESDNAAVSLLQLATHTPRVSPEPGASFQKTVLNSATRGGVEDPLRTSHPSHTPSDPWPLSYRPTEPVEDILPTSARGTGYGSRAASPPPHHPHRSLAHVPSVTESTRLRILYKVRELSASDPSLSERFVPRLELLELFTQLYFDKYHALFPIVHKPTWDPNTAPSFLTLAIASVGARYAWERVVGASMHAHALLESARRLAQIMGDLDNTLLRTVAWQQTILIVLQSGMMSGNKRDLERTQAFASMPITFARRQGWLKEPQVDEQAEELFPLDERWRRWRDREEIRRLGFGAVTFDCSGTALWNMDTASLYLDAANTPLPCHDALWDAPSSAAWSSLFRHSILPPASPTLSHAVHLACSFASLSGSALTTLSSISRDAFALSTVLSVLHSLGWERVHARAVEKTFLTPGSGADAGGKAGDGLKKEDGEERIDEVDAAQAALEAGIEFFQDRILLPPDLLARLDDPGAASGTMALMVHLTALTQRLPIRVLQPLARSATAPAQPATLAALRSWALAGHGSVARTTAYHAGQLIALCRPALSASVGGSSSSSSEGPLEPFALFYAALALVAFVREGGGGPPPSSDEAAAAATKASGSKSPSEGHELVLDTLRDRSDSVLAAWVHSGPLGSRQVPAAAVPSLRLLGGTGQPDSSSSSTTGRLDSSRAAERILSCAAKRLQALKVWKVGDLLGSVLEQLAAVERLRLDEQERGDALGLALGALKEDQDIAAAAAAAALQHGDQLKALGGGGGGGGTCATGSSVAASTPAGGDEDEDDELDEDFDDEEQNA